MIYDPRRRAIALRQKILESMTAEELEEYARALRVIDDSDVDLPSDAELQREPKGKRK